MKRVLLLSGLLLSASGAQGIELEDLRPGLIVSHRDKAKLPVRIVALEPGVALSLGAGEAPHPRLAADGESFWEGYINVLRAGPHRFDAVVHGIVRVHVGGKEMLFGEKFDAPGKIEGKEIRLEAGPQAINVVFNRAAKEARLELRWRGPGFRDEPLPYIALFHDPKKAPAELPAHRRSERGRFLFEERNCIGCHQAGADDRLARGLTGRQGPILSKVAERTYPGWIYEWLLDPHKVRPGAAMPRLFADGDDGRAEAYAVAAYLNTLGKPLAPPTPLDAKAAKARETRSEQGRKLFFRTGCVACHPSGIKEKDDDPKQLGTFHALGGGTGARSFALGGLGSKTSEKALSAYLLNPLAIDPSGRMPDMKLAPKDADALAAHLTAVENKAIPHALPEMPKDDLRKTLLTKVSAPDDVAKKSVEKQWQEIGRRLVDSRNCAACHTIAPEKEPLKSKSVGTFASLREKAKSDKGCLGDAAERTAPRHALSGEESTALVAFLKDGGVGAGSPAPAHAARASLERFNCLACHTRDGEGGLSPGLIVELRKHEKVENAEDLVPPTLTGIGHKLRTSWFREVLTKSGRARPWMAMTMPQFGESNVAGLPEAVAALEGIGPDDSVHRIETTKKHIEDGRFLMSKQAFGCVSCHDLAGIPNTGTRGADLATSVRRVRYDWYQRWMWDAQRMAPGTRMPTVFPEGKSLVAKIAGGHAEAQTEAMWAYMSLGPTLPLPEGMSRVPLGKKGFVLEVGEQPHVLRTFMPQAGSRAFAIGYPGGISLAYDALGCRSVYAWSGGFLDASPVWDGRGGRPAGLLGPIFWNAPEGHPWGLGDSPPDFAARAKDMAFGGPQTEKVFLGVKQVHFLGHSLDREGRPTFQSRLGNDESDSVKIAERPEPLSRPGAAVGLRRAFAIESPAKSPVWFNVGELKTVRFVNGKGEAIDDKRDTQELDVGEVRAILPRGDDRVVVLRVTTAPAGTMWVAKRSGTSRLLYLRLPAGPGERKMILDAWAPYRDDPGLIREVLNEEKKP